MSPEICRRDCAAVASRRILLIPIDRRIKPATIAQAISSLFEKPGFTRLFLCAVKPHLNPTFPFFHASDSRLPACAWHMSGQPSYAFVAREAPELPLALMMFISS
ncbi:hypothetical protein [Beijerinckia mobilis]|uniref:hypothetical protein n=1 Tax=Beijerinckia mobilis TaxID=231434 RepID=UPI0012EBD95E|nr:hypothetical protein [Beijerinckia mobilis]